MATGDQTYNPSIATTQTVQQNKLLGRGSTSGSGQPEEIAIGSGLSLVGTTITASGGGGGAPDSAQFVTLATDATLTQERVLTGSGRVSVTDGGAGTTVTLDIPNNGVGNAQLRQSGALAVVARAANSTGNVADLQATAASDAVLIESGSALTFGQVATAGLANDAVTNAKLRNSGALTVIGRGANSTGDPADIAAVAGSDAVLIETGSTVAFGQVATAGLANNAVTDTKLRDSAAVSVLGRAANSSGDPGDIAASTNGHYLQRNSNQLQFAAIAAADVPATLNSNARVSVTKNDGAEVGLRRQLNFKEGTNVTLTIADDSGNEQVDITIAAAGASGAPSDAQYVTLATNGTLTNERVLTGSTRVTVTDAGAGSTVTLDVGTNSIGNTFLRQGTALTVVGRSANSTGDVADIAAVAASDAVLRESGSTVGFGTIATAGIANNAVTDAKLRDGGALSVIGRSANSSGDPADISAAAASGAVLRESGSTIGFGTIATAGIADAAVTMAKIVDGTACTVVSRAANSTGVHADLAAASNGHYLSRQSNALAFGAIVAADLPAASSSAQGAMSAADFNKLANIADQYKKSVRVVGTANLTLSGTQTIDGVSCIAGDRVLAAKQTTASARGIYVVASGAWSRSTDFDADAEVTSAVQIAVEEGTTYSSTVWMLTTANAITVGSTSLTFAKVGGRVSFVALTDAATIAVDASLFAVNNTDVATVTLGGNRTLGNWTNATAGQRIQFQARQDGTGSRTLAYDTKYRFSADVTSPTLSTGASKLDKLLFEYQGADDKFDADAVNKGF